MSGMLDEEPRWSCALVIALAALVIALMSTVILNTFVSSELRDVQRRVGALETK